MCCNMGGQVSITHPFFLSVDAVVFFPFALWLPAIWMGPPVDALVFVDGFWLYSANAFLSKEDSFPTEFIAN